MGNAVIVGLDRIRRESELVLQSAGVMGRPITCGAAVGYEYLVPASDGSMLRARSVVVPPVEVSGKLGRKIRKKLKKVVKSRAFKALGKLAKAAASVVPGGAAIVTAASVAEKAARAIKAAKRAKVSGDYSVERALGPALIVGADEIRAARLAVRSWA